MYTHSNYDEKLKVRPYKQRFGPLTCIIGAHCAEGYVIIADTRVTNDFEATSESKFSEFWDRRVFLACAGLNAVIHRFNDVLKEKTETSEPSNFKQVYEIVEDALSETRSRYYPRLEQDYDIELLLIGLENFKSGEPKLKRIDRYSVTENISNFTIIGHAKQYATTLFKLMHNNMLTLKETALLGSFVITSVTNLELDQSVGTSVLGPEVVIIKDDEFPYYFNISDKDFVRTNKIAESLVFRDALVKYIWNNIPQPYSHIS